MNDRFPSNDKSAEGAHNPAIQLYGRRFYKDQTPVEYLAEFLLAFSSPKGIELGTTDTSKFSFGLSNDTEKAKYCPDDHIALKLFAFLPTSKLDTRHEVHANAYKELLDDLRNRVVASGQDTEVTIQLLQSLFAGFVGVPKTRTWVTQCFLPVSHSLLAREITWNHPSALKNSKNVEDTTSSEHMSVYFDRNTHNFMGRGGELLFLQLAHLFNEHADRSFSDLLPESEANHLHHFTIHELQHSIESNLSNLLRSAIAPIDELAQFCEQTCSAFPIKPKRSPTQLGWVPTSSLREASLFAFEANNICSAVSSPLEKLELLQTLCMLHVLRSLCFQAIRQLTNDSKNGDSKEEIRIEGTLGNYAWICAAPEVPSNSPGVKLAQISVDGIENILYRAIRTPGIEPDIHSIGERKYNQALKNGDDNCFRLFRKFAKDFGLVIPRTGKGQRFVLPKRLMHFLVVALIEPGHRISLDRFFERVFAHYGIALGPRQLAAALAHQGGADAAHHDYAIAADTRWIEETLRQGDFLVELSDAVSIVRNPAAKIQEPEKSA